MNSLIILLRYLFRDAASLCGSSGLCTLCVLALDKVLVRGLVSGARGVLNLRIFLGLRCLDGKLIGCLLYTSPSPRD